MGKTTDPAIAARWNRPINRAPTRWVGSVPFVGAEFIRRWGVRRWPGRLRRHSPDESGSYGRGVLHLHHHRPINRAPTGEVVGILAVGAEFIRRWRRCAYSQAAFQ